MTAQQTNLAVVLGVIAACYSGLLGATFRYVTARTPAGIVRQLYRTGRPVTIVVNFVNTEAWDPSKPLGQGGFYDHGVATYTLNDQRTISVRFQPRSGAAAIERSAQIPLSVLPDSPATHRRRVLARLVITLYLFMGSATFAVTAALVSGTASFRVRVVALTALGTVALTWLAMHLLLTRRRSREASATPPAQRHHLIVWIVSYLAVVGAFGVAWRLGNLDQPRPMSWASAFLSASIFVAVCIAAISASLHHHTYLHHEDKQDPGNHKP